MEQNIISIKETFDYLYLNERLLSASQAEFVASLKTYYNKNKQLSEKQASALFEIKKFLNVPEPVRYSQIIINTKK